MKITLRIFFWLFLTSSYAAAYAQETVLISGTVTSNETSEPLVGTSVAVKGTVAGTVTDTKGNFSLRTRLRFPFTLVFSMVGFQPQEFEIKGPTSNLRVALVTQTMLGNELVVTASRVSETQLKSPVSIEKLDVRAIKETPAPSFYDALEAVKGVQVTTLSLGFKVPNTRGFNNTTNARFLQMVDGADNQAPGLGVAIANTAGPTELDIESVELTPGASSALYGLNALNGISNLITKSPFLYQGLSVYHKTGVNHVDGKDIKPSLLTESAIRYAKAFNDRFAFKVNVGYLQGKDWVADNRTDINPDANVSLGLTGANNPGSDLVNNYGDEGSNRNNNLSMNGKIFAVSRTGYLEKQLTDYNVQNLKADVAFHYKLNDQVEASYAYRIGSADNIYQRGNRIRLQGYSVQQHKVDIKGSNFLLRGYYTVENTGKSYAMRPLAEVLDRTFKSDKQWFADYKTEFERQTAAGQSVEQSLQLARTYADQGRFQPGTPLFQAKADSLNAINNWDVGSAFVLKSSFYQVEGQYDLKNQIKFVDLLVGADYRNYIIVPDGNEFINRQVEGQNITNYKYGGFAQATKRFFNESLKVVASVRVDKNEYFSAKFNPRLAVVYTFREKHNFRASYQNGYRFPTLFEAFSFVNNGGVRRVGGLALMSQDLQIFENSYLRSTVDNFRKAVNTDFNRNGVPLDQAIQKNQGLLKTNPYTYIQPEHIDAFEVGYKSVLFDNKVLIDADAYYNVYKNFIDQIEVVVPQQGKIGVDASTPAAAYDKTKSDTYRMWTNSQSLTHNYGGSLGLAYNFYQKYSFSGNLSYSVLSKVSNSDALVAAFNTPKYIVNLSFGNREIVRNVGFNVAWRWQDAFDWRSPLANGRVPAYQTFDAQVTYKVPSLKTSFKLGGSNIFNQRYFQYTGGPIIGGLYYLAITFDGLLK